MASCEAVQVATQYARDVVDGRIPAGKLTRLACRRQLDDLARWADDPDAPFWFDDEPGGRADDVAAFFSQHLYHVKGKWKKQRATLQLEPWQLFVVTTTFGWVCRDNAAGRAYGDAGTRRFRVVYVEVPRKNGKSTLAAGIALYLLLMDGEEGAEIYSTASTGGQARIVFDVAKRMVEISPTVGRHLSVFADNISHDASWSKFEPINSKSQSAFGYFPHGVINDEVHVQRRELWNTMLTGMGPREQPMMVGITTAGSDSDGLCWEQHEYGRKVLEQVLPDEQYFCIVYHLDLERDDAGREIGDDWRDPQVWGKANPNLHIMAPGTLDKAVREATEIPSKAPAYKRDYFGIWVAGHSPWLAVEAWDGCVDAGLQRLRGWPRDILPALAERIGGQPCWAGLDLADKNDIASMQVLWFEERGEIPCSVDFHYLPADLVTERAHDVTAHYAGWASAGYLLLTPGDYIDHAVIQADVEALFRALQLKLAVFDQHSGADLMISALDKAGFQAIRRNKNAGTFTPPAKALEARVQRNKYRHTGSPVMRWMMSNCVVDRRTDGSILPKKNHKDSPHKIDGMDALLLAYGAALEVPDEQYISPWVAVV